MSIQPVSGRALWGAALLIPALLWGLAAFRAHQHCRLGMDAQTGQKLLEAGREYETAIGFYAPLNPWSRAAARSLAAMVEEARDKDSALAFELEDRLRRSIQGIRWLVHPYAGILAGLGTPPGPPPRDPDPWLFFLSLAGLAAACSAPWMSRQGMPFRWALAGSGLAVWALALRFC